MSLKDRKSVSEKLRLENKKMELRLQQLKMTMTKEKEERLANGNGPIWSNGVSEGGILNYKRNIIKVDPSKKLKVKMLKDEPIHENVIRVPKKYIDVDPHISGDSDEGINFNFESGKKIPRSVKCGQCEENKAAVNCQECSEYYCPKCFAAFHLKGALRKHRSTPISTVNTRVSIPSPLFKAPELLPDKNQSNNSKLLPSKLSSRGLISHGKENVASLSNGNHSQRLREPRTTAASSSSVGLDAGQSVGNNDSSPVDPGSNLNDGQFNEEFSQNYFQDALNAWREGRELSQQKHSDIKRPSTDHGTQSSQLINDARPSAHNESQSGTTALDKIQFTPSLSYAEQLLLKKARTQLMAPIEMKYILSRLSRNNEMEMNQNQKLLQSTIELESMLSSQRQSDHKIIEDSEHLDLSSLTQLWNQAEKIISKLPTYDDNNADVVSNQFVLPRPQIQMTTVPIDSDRYIDEKVRRYTDQLPKSQVTRPPQPPADTSHNDSHDHEGQPPNPEHTRAAQSSPTQTTSNIASSTSTARQTMSARQRMQYNDRPQSSRRMSARSTHGGNLTTKPSKYLEILADFNNYLNGDVNTLSSLSMAKANQDGPASSKLSYAFYKTSPKCWKPTQAWSLNGETEIVVDDVHNKILPDDIIATSVDIIEELDKLNSIANINSNSNNNVVNHISGNISLVETESSGELLPNVEMNLYDDENEVEEMQIFSSRLQCEITGLSYGQDQKNESNDMHHYPDGSDNDETSDVDDIVADSLDQSGAEFRLWEDDKFRIEDSLDFRNNSQLSSTTTKEEQEDLDNSDEDLTSSRFNDYNDVYNLV